MGHPASPMEPAAVWKQPHPDEYVPSDYLPLITGDLSPRRRKIGCVSFEDLLYDLPTIRKGNVGSLTARKGSRDIATRQKGLILGMTRARDSRTWQRSAIWQRMGFFCANNLSR